MVEIFIAAHPEMAAWFIRGLIALVVALFGLGYRLMSKRLGELQKADGELATRVGGLEARVGLLEPHVGAGKESLHELSESVKGVAEQLRELQVENVEAHAKIVVEQGEKLTTNAERLARIETRMDAFRPLNGEIAEILAILKGQKKS